MTQVPGAIYPQLFEASYLEQVNTYFSGLLSAGYVAKVIHITIINKIGN